MIFISIYIHDLKEKFEIVKQIGWIEGISNGPGSIGVTFERMIGLSYNEFEIPDFEDIEIKTKRRSSNAYISLFNSSMDGKYLFSSKKLVEEYGWPDKNFRYINILFGDVFGDKLLFVGKHRKMKLDVNYCERKIFLKIYSDSNFLLSDNEFFWSFDLIEEKLLRKLSFLALVKADNKFINGKEFFFYNDIKFYKLKSFDTFCNLLSTGFIRVTFKSGVQKGKNHLAFPYDHGTSFAIRESDLEKLFDVI